MSVYSDFTFGSACNDPMCRLSALLSLNGLSQYSHGNLRPLWISMCRLRPDAWKNDLGHLGHWCKSITGDSVCIRLKCWRRISRCVNVLSHAVHANGRSPVCTISWRLRISFWMNERPHWLHLNGFSPVCVRQWRLSELLLGNHFSHIWHMWPRRFSWIGAWRASWMRRAKASGQLSHWKILISPLASRLSMFLPSSR